MAPSRLSLLVLLAAGSIASSLAETEWYTRNRNTIESIYNLTVYPHNLAVLNGSIPPGLFDDNANGRITPVGEFFGFQDSVEYFWGLAPVPSGHPPNAVFASADVVHFVSGCPEVAASTVYFTYKTLNPDNTPGAFVTKLKQVAFWHFDAAGAVLAYDAWIPNIQKTVGHTQPAQATTCVGDNEVYADADECVHILGQRDFGDWDDVWGDNVVCRLIHARLAILRPEVHCVHVGPTGGGKCVDVEYNDVYYNDELVFGEHGAATFDCGTYRD